MELARTDSSSEEGSVTSLRSRRLLVCLADTIFSVTALQMETYQVAPNKPTHGYDGPLKISHGGFYTNMGKQFLEVAASYDKTRGTTDDPSDMIGINAYGVSLVTYYSRMNSTML